MKNIFSKLLVSSYKMRKTLNSLGDSLGKVAIFFLFFLSTSNLIYSQCTNDVYGNYSNLNPICGSGANGAWATSFTDCYPGEYSLVDVTAGSTYQFQTYRSNSPTFTGRYATVATTGNVALVWGNTSSTVSISWTATFTGQVRFYTHLSNTCGTSTQNSTRRVRCSAPACTPPALPGFGNNVWNVECYEGNNFNTYRGFYTDNNLSFNSANRWGTGSTPSAANATGGNAYVGCSISNDNHSYAYKRQGFPPGSYVINVNRDDDYILLVNGIQVSTGVCCNWTNNAWSGTLNATSTVEVRFREYTGGSQGEIQLIALVPPACAGSPTAPANSSTGISTSPTLSWAAVSGATGYDVYFGTSATPPLVSTNQAGTTYVTGTLNATTTYYWRIVPRNTSGLASGCDTWSFTTGVPGCTNGTAYTTFTPTCSGTQQIYNTCTYAGDYNTLTLNGGTAYLLGSSITSDYITVTTSAGVIITAGVQPLNFTPTASDQYRVYYHTNAACGTAAACRSVWVQCGTPPTPPANDACANATSLPCGTSNLSGTTVNSVSETVPAGAGSNFGVWYTFTGDGQNTTITSTTTFDHRLTVLTGACGTNTILVSQDGSAGTETVTFLTTNGLQYRVYVSHYLAGSTTTGTFTISRSCAPAPLPAWKTTWVSMNTGSSVWCAGETRNITVTVTNAGANTWTNAGPDVNIGVKWNGDPDYLVRVDANGLASLATQTYTFSVTAPTTAGFNNLSFDVVNEGNFWFANNPSGVGPGNIVYRSLPLTIVAAPNPVTAGSPSSICPTSSVQLNGAASGSVINEQFENVANQGWIVNNMSSPVGSTSWFQGSTATFPGQSGGYIGVNFNSVAGNNTISNWLISSQMTINNGDVISFYTRGPGMGFADRMQLRMSTNGSSVSVGADANSIGDFTTLLLDINPTLSPTGYPATWTLYTVTISGLSAPVSGRIAFRYFVTSGGPSGANSDYVGIDNFTYTPLVNTVWTPGTSLSSTTILNPIATPSATTIYTLTANQMGCSNAGNTTITVNNTPDFANLQWPASATVNCGSGVSVFGKVFEPGVTPNAGADPSISVEIGVSTSNTNPATWPAGAWSAASYNGQVVNDDEYTASIGSTLAPGTYYYTFRYQIGNSGCYVYGGFQGGFWNGTSNVNGTLTVNGSILDWANVQFPTSGSICVGGSYTVYGQVFESGVTNAAGATPGMIAEIGVSSTNTDPATWAAGAWSATSFNAQAGNNDEFVATIGSSLAAGTYYYAFRYRLASACNYQYGAINGFWNGTSNQNGTLTINAIPTVTANATSTSVCTGQSVTLTGGGATSYTWNNGVSNGVAFVPTNTATYTVTGTTAGCSATADVTVTFNALTSNTLPTSGDYVWRGSSSSDYATVANWLQHNGTSLVAATVAPTTSNNVIIPATQTCVLNQPALISNTVNSRNMTIETGAAFNMGSGTLNVGGNLTNNGTFNAGTGTVTFSGTSTQSIGGANAPQFYNLTVNKSTGNVVLTSNTSVSNNLTLTSGLIELGANNLSMGTAALSGGSSTSYVKTASTGVLSRNVGNTATTFPVGNGTYNRAILTNSGTADNFTLRVIDNVTADGTGVGTPTSEPVVNRTWMVNETTAGGSDVTLRLYWNGLSEETNSFVQPSAFIAHYLSSAGSWDNIGKTNEGADFVETNNITSFSPFAISSSGTFAPLPIELVSFQANCKEDNSVAVSWTTASEHNTSHYVVEKSRDGSNWSVLGQTAAAGNSTQLLNYEMIDSEKASGATYYRLTQFDNDGVFEVFDPVSVNCNAATTNNHITTYPNPSLDGFYVSLFTETMEGNGQLTITDASGRPVYGKSVNIQDGNNVFHIGDLNAAPGMYYIQVSNGTTTTHIVKHSLR